jgi:hypothetical protein
MKRRLKNTAKEAVCSFSSPDNTTHTTENLAKFCREIVKSDNPEQFRKGLSKVRSGKLKSYLGWSLA